MRFAEAVAELDARQPTRMVPTLERIRALVELLDHPERTYPSIHVTGTNGKTTTARLIGRVLCAHGIATGIYTSPHLSSVVERVALCDDDIPEADFAESYAHLLPFLREVDGRGERVTYFEAITALAFLWFADKPVEAAVLEVGMGGEWDATNVADAQVAVIREVALDHRELGSTVEAVALEKAGVIKAGATVVTHDEPPEALAIVETRAADVGATVVRSGRDFRIDAPQQAVGGQRFRLEGLHAAYEDLVLPLFGAHQVDNAASAVVASEAFLGRALDGDAVREALAGATAPGRLEVVSRHPLVVLDGAHNPAGAPALAEALPETFVWRTLHLVVGVLDSKDVAGILEPLASRTSLAYACSNSSPKALGAEAMAAACEEAGMQVRAFADVSSALDAAESAAEDDDLILVTGSLYTVADARPRYVTTHA